MAAADLLEAVAALVDRHMAELDGDARSDLEAVARRIREPVRIAIVGRVKAGKSTMVNALLGQRVAPTDVSECTRVVTWFRYGSPQRVVVELEDGGTIETQLDPGGVLPAELGVPLDSVRSVQVHLSNTLLKSMTLIDTPGLGSVHPAYVTSTKDLLDASRRSAVATDRADAVVLLMNQVLLEDEMDVLTRLRDASEDPVTSSRTLGVLSRADQLGDGSTDSWQVAVELADHYRDVLRDQVASVVPVIGLMAETAQTAGLTELDAKALTELARLPEGDLVKLTWSAERFVKPGPSVPVEQRARLLDALGLYGVQRAIELVAAGESGAGAVRRHLAERSGIESVRTSLVALFDEQAQVLKARSAMAALSRISYGSSDSLVRLRNDIEALRFDPIMQPVAEIQAWHAVSSGQTSLPDDLREDVRRLAIPGSARSRLGCDDDRPATLQAAAKAALGRWRAFLNGGASPAQQAIARVALRSYQILWRSVQ